MLQTSSNSLKCKYGFSKSKPWKVGKSWIMLDLKLKWDASERRTIHDGALVLVRFMWSLSVVTWLFSLFSLWSDWLSSSAILSEEDEDFLQSLPLNVLDHTLMQVQKERKRKKEKEETKIRKTIKVKIKIK